MNQSDHLDPRLTGLFEGMGFRRTAGMAGGASYRSDLSGHKICILVRELVVGGDERRADRSRALLDRTGGRRIGEFIRDMEPIRDIPSLLVLTSPDPESLADAGYFIRHGLHGAWSSGEVSHDSWPRTAMDEHERRPPWPSAVGLVGPSPQPQLQVYLNKDAGHPLPLEAFPLSQVHVLRLVVDPSGAGVGWESAR